MPRALAKAWRWVAELRANEKWRLELVEVADLLHRLLDQPPAALREELDRALLHQTCAHLGALFHALERSAGERVEELARLYEEDRPPP